MSRHHIVSFRVLPEKYFRHSAGVAGIATLADGRQYEAIRFPDGRIVIPPAARREDIPDHGPSVFSAQWTVEVHSAAGLPRDYYRAEHFTRAAAEAEARRLIEGALMDNLVYIRVWAPEDKRRDAPVLDWSA